MLREYRYHLKHLGITSLILLSFSGLLQAQYVTFKTITGSGIQAAMPSPASLDFGQLIKGSENKSMIMMNDDAAVCIEVSAPRDYEITAWFELPATLICESDNQFTIPADLRFAYNNRAGQLAGCSSATKLGAIQVPLGFTTVTFPVSFRSAGLPLPPPTPEHQGYTVPMETFYLIIYGAVGPASVDIPAGNYTSEIIIHLELNTNEE